TVAARRPTSKLPPRKETSRPRVFFLCSWVVMALGPQARSASKGLLAGAAGLWFLLVRIIRRGRFHSRGPGTRVTADTGGVLRSTSVREPACTLTCRVSVTGLPSRTTSTLNWYVYSQPYASGGVLKQRRAASCLVR